MTALELAKATFETRDDVYLVMDDFKAKKVLKGWTKYHPHFKDFPTTPKDNPDELMPRLWASIGPIDYGKLAEICGFPASRTARIFKRMQAAHLAWPDGSISKSALTLIKTEAELRLRGWSPPPKSRGAPQP